MKRSILAFIGSMAGLIYTAYLAAALFISARPHMTALRLGAYTLQFPTILPHLAVIALADLMNWLGFAARKRGGALAAALLYCASIPLMPALFPAALALSLLALLDFARLSRRKGSTRFDDFGASEEGGEAPYPDSDEESGTARHPGRPALEPAAKKFEASPGDGYAAREALPHAAHGHKSALPREGPPPEDDEWTLNRVDGVSVFLGLFAAVALLALIGVVLYGLTGFEPPFIRR